jgi:hypothetical protein
VIVPSLPVLVSVITRTDGLPTVCATVNAGDRAT